jgi:CO/xanthine dehydrogenase FAD-binding subunit
VWQNYLFAESVDHALALLAQHEGAARIIAGGTDLVLQSHQKKCPSTVMVDVTRIPGLGGIEERDGHIEIGALATHGQVAASPLIQTMGRVLAEACAKVGGPQIRNMATLVGNVINALPAADGAVALFALDAEAQVVDDTGSRWIPIDDLYAGVGVCTIDSCVEMVTALRFASPSPGQRGAFERLARRRSLTLPIVNAGVVVDIEEGRFADARIAVGPVARTPFRAKRAEDVLRGSEVSAEVIGQAAELAQADARPRDSYVRGSKGYRSAMVQVLVRRALLRASKAS